MLSPGQQQQETPTHTSHQLESGSSSRHQLHSNSSSGLPNSNNERGNNGEKTDQSLMKVSFERYMSQILSSSEIEAHEERLKKILQEANNLSKDEWMFTPINKLLGNWTS